MRHLVQYPLADEMLSSVWMRTGQIAVLGPTRLFQSLGYATAMFKEKFFGYAGANMLSECTGLSLAQVFQDHTILPFATSVMSGDEAARCLEDIVSGHISAGPIFTSSVRVMTSKRWCSPCRELDLKTYGFSYWHRVHNVPGVLICPIHRTPLLSAASDRTHVRSATSWLLPHQMGSGTPIIEAASPYIELLCDAAVRRLVSPEQERQTRGHDWLRARVQELMMNPDDGRYRARLAFALRELVKGVSHAIFGKTLDDALMTMSNLVASKYEAQLSPIRYLAIQAAMELSKGQIPVEQGLRTADERSADLASAFVDMRIASRTPTKVYEVWEAAGYATPAKSRYPLVAKQTDRLKHSAAWFGNQPSSRAASRSKHPRK
jgi:hypothetical protein